MFRRVLFIAVVSLVLLLASAVHARVMIHKVRKGQNLGMIAKRYHTTPAAIRKANKLRRGQKIYPGQKLRIVEVAQHRKWREYLEAKKKPAKKKVSAKPSKRPRKVTRNKIDKRKAKKSKKKRPKASKRQSGTYERNRAKKSEFARKPYRPGYVTLVRPAHNQKYRGTLVDKKGRVVGKASKRIDRLMRSRHGGKKHKINRRLLKLLTQVSNHFGGRTIIVVSGYRPYRKKQYTKNSRHNHGKAIDFRIVGVPTVELYKYCRGFSKVGCGYYPNSGFIHMDVRRRKTQWTDYSRPGQAPIYAKKSRKRKKTRPKEQRPTAAKKKKATTKDSTAKKKRPTAKKKRPTTKTKRPTAKKKRPTAKKKRPAPTKAKKPPKRSGSSGSNQRGAARQ